MATEVKSSGAAIVMSVFWTGLGQLYAGQIGKGLVMMALTPIVWATAVFGGGLSVLGGLAAMGGAATDDRAGAMAGSGVGMVGFGLVLGAVAWWIWGIVDARRICETYNAGVGSGVTEGPAT